MNESTNARNYRTKRDYVVEALREAILSGEIEPGRHLRQEEIAQEMGISPTPVREALRRLEADGLITHVAHKGVRVAEFTAEDAKEVYLIRSVLESLATQIAMLNISDEEIAKLEGLKVQMEELLKANLRKHLPELNDEFHMTIYSASQMPRLCRLIDRLWMHSPRDTLWVIPQRAAHSMEEHRQILAAVRARDEAQATELVRQHVLNSGSAVVGYIREIKQTS